MNNFFDRLNETPVERRTLSDKDRAKVLERDGYKCRYCGSTKLPLHVDHIYPWSKGG